MTLYDLMSAMTLQGDIDVRVMNDDGETVKEEYFECVDDLEMCEISRLEDMENLEVKYMYPEIFTKHYYPNGANTRACMVIELEESED